MNKGSSDKEIVFHASSTGRLYIKGDEFFKSKKVQALIDKLRSSSIYKHLKEERGQAKITTP